MHFILEWIVYPTQSAFVPNHTIHENVLAAHKILNKCHSLKEKRLCHFEIGKEKAYHRVNWNFLFYCLTEIGFHSTWIN